MRYRFGGVDLDTDTYELRMDGRSIDVEPQVFEVLAYLVAHRDRVVPKEELLDQIWGNRFVSESALTTRIKQARQAVGDDGKSQRVIRTVHGRGYRFVAPVDAPADPHAPADPRPPGDPPPLGDRPGPWLHPARDIESARDLAPAVDLEPVPETHYVSHDGAAIAYQVFGSGPDLVLIGGFVSNVEVQWEHPAIARFLRSVFRPTPARRALVHSLVGGSVQMHVAEVNGGPAVLFTTGGQVVGVLSPEVTADGITALHIQANPDKLERISQQWAAAERTEPYATVW